MYLIFSDAFLKMIAAINVALMNASAMLVICSFVQFKHVFISVNEFSISLKIDKPFILF